MINAKRSLKIFKRIMSIVIIMIVLVFIVVIGVNLFVVKSTEDGIRAVFDSDEDRLTAEEIEEMKSLDADCIMVLEQGRIIERGTHDQLIEQKGKYYQLYTGNQVTA